MLSLPNIPPAIEADPWQTFWPFTYTAALNRSASTRRNVESKPGLRFRSSSKEPSRYLAMYSKPSCRKRSLSRSVNFFVTRRFLERTNRCCCTNGARWYLCRIAGMDLNCCFDRFHDIQERFIDVRPQADRFTIPWRRLKLTEWKIMPITGAQNDWYDFRCTILVLLHRSGTFPGRSNNRRQ
jgi:hypothetical protein